MAQFKRMLKQHKWETLKQASELMIQSDLSLCSLMQSAVYALMHMCVYVNNLNILHQELNWNSTDDAALQLQNPPVI